MQSGFWSGSLEHGTEVEIKLQLNRFPDSSVSSLIQAGWCEGRHPATKYSLQYLESPEDLVVYSEANVTTLA